MVEVALLYCCKSLCITNFFKVQADV